MKRPNVYEEIPASGPEKRTICAISDIADYKNNRNTRPNTSYKRTRQTSLSIDVRHKPRGKTMPGTWAWQYGKSPVFSYHKSKMDGLIAQCKSSLYDEIGGIMLGHDLSKALSATGSFFRKIPKAAKLLHRGRFSKAAKALGFKGKAKAIPNTYLGYTYAVAPLVQDIAHLWDFLTNKDPVVFRIVRTKTAPRIVEVETQELTSYPRQILTARTERIYKLSARVIRVYTSECFKPLEGITFHPVPAIWDALPYSFVVDWFLPVEGCLQQLYQEDARSIDGCNCAKYECTTSVTFPRGTISVEKTTAPSPAYWEWKAGLTTATSFQFERKVDLSTKWTTAEALGAVCNSTSLGVRRCLNAFALAWQALSR